jgi:L-type amino acid transporter 13
MSWFQTIGNLVKMAILCVTGIVLLVTGRKDRVSRFENALEAKLPDASQTADALLQGL